MIEQRWCDRVTHLLSLPDHDTCETTLNIMSTLADACKETFIHSKDKLVTLEKEYRVLAEEDEEDSYFTHIAQLTNDLINTISYSSPTKHDKIEL